MRVDRYAADRNDERRKLAGEADPGHASEIDMLIDSLHTDPLSETARCNTKERLAYLQNRHAVQIIVGSRAVWVNDQYSCLGRFGVYGIDVHRRLDDQYMGECLDCTHGPVDADDWRRFQQSMLMHHGVDLTDVEMPAFVMVESR